MTAQDRTASERLRLLVTRRLPEMVMDRIAREYEVQLADLAPDLDDRVLWEGAEGCDAILCAPGDSLAAASIANLPGSVRALATYSVGHEHIDLEAARSRGIAVFHTPGVLTDATAEVAMLLLLGAARRAWEGQALVRSGKWAGWEPTQLLGRTLAGKRLGVLGMGRIGSAVALRARAFGMEIHYCNRKRLGNPSEGGAVFHSTPRELFSNSDFLTLHCPASEATQQILDARSIGWLPRGAVVVNSARGSLVDDAALIAALRSGHLAAAGLDVYEGEPAVNPAYLQLENVYLLPHLGSATVEARNAMGHKALDNLAAFFGGSEAPNRLV
ncbi:D-glycerate dehydrogenase [Myxococcota bacterium]|nr:D-glycerate dehydrogenase [Myxococcota bacterium]